MKKVKTYEAILFMPFYNGQQSEFKVLFTGTRSELDVFCYSMNAREISVITKEV